MRALRTAIAGFRAHRGLFLASGLAFTLLTCLIPILFFMISIAGFVLNRRAATEMVLTHLGQLVPVYRDELHKILIEIVQRRNLSGLLGTAVLLLFGSQLFASIRLVLDEVFGFTRGHGFFRGTLKDILLLLLMCALFLASVVLTDLFGWIEVLFMTPARMAPESIRSVFIAAAVVFNAALFFVAYRYFPHRKVPAGAALAGALLASVLWESAKQLFRWYILTGGVYDRIYGPLGVLVALAMFAYYSGVVFILGAEFTAALAEGARRRR